MIDSKTLHKELWTSWASVLRSYAAAHGLNAPQHAVVEVSAERITLRVGSRWLQFTAEAVEESYGPTRAFHLNANGTVTLDTAPEEEMDLVAERFAREMMSDA